MLTNATILRIDRAGTPDATGRPRIATGSDTEIRCAIDMINGRQRYTLGAVLEDATQVIYIERPALANAGEEVPGNGDQVTLLSDGATASHTVAIVTTGDHIAPGGGDLSHLELFVRRILS